MDDSKKFLFCFGLFSPPALGMALTLTLLSMLTGLYHPAFFPARRTGYWVTILILALSAAACFLPFAL